MARVDAIDISNYSTIPTPPQVQCLKDIGVKTVIVGASYGQVARAQLEAAVNGGLGVEIYAWISHPFNASLITRALNTAVGLPIKKIWLDAEAPTNGRSPDQVVQDIRDAVSFAKSQRPDLDVGIYTGSWWWAPNTNNYSGADLCKLDLWVANYRDPTNYPLDKVLTGGWTVNQLAMWQYAGTVQTCDLNTDLNIIIPRSNRMYSDQQIDVMFAIRDNRITNLVSSDADQGSDIAKHLGLIQALGKALFEHIQNHGGAYSDEQKADIQKTIDTLAAQQKILTDKIAAAGVAFAGQ